MKRNKTFNIIVSLFAFLPLILICISALVMIFNKNYTVTDIPSIINSNMQDILVHFGVGRFAGNGSDVLDSSIYMSNGWGIPFLPYFLSIFTTKDNIVAYSGYLIFANWYMNYVLLVYLVAFIPKILLTFINFGYNLCDKFTERSEKRW